MFKFIKFQQKHVEAFKIWLSKSHVKEFWQKTESDKKFYFYIFIPLILFNSCASLKSYGDYGMSYQKHITAGKCEAAQEQIPLEKDETKYLQFYQGALGYLAYVSTIPVTVGFDLIVLGRCRYICPEQGTKPELEIIFPASTYTYEHTKDMRCPDTSYYAQKLLEISKCYESREDEASLQKARDQLRFIEESYESLGPSCLKLRDYKSIVAIRVRIDEKIKKLHSHTVKNIN